MYTRLKGNFESELVLRTKIKSSERVFSSIKPTDGVFTHCSTELTENLLGIYLELN